MKYFASLDADLSPPRSREKALEAEIREEIFGGGWKVEIFGGGGKVEIFGSRGKGGRREGMRLNGGLRKALVEEV